MSTATLNNLLEYLYGTLTPDNMRWVGRQLIEHADKEEASLKPYTIEELHARIDKAERDSDEGRYRYLDDFLHELEEEFAKEDRKELSMQETV